jgi:hypothetical protein
MPTEAVPHGADTGIREHSVISRGIHVVTGRRNEIEASSVSSPVRRALEAAEDPALEEARSRRSPGSLRACAVGRRI